jgi:hypothetical protein
MTRLLALLMLAVFFVGIVIAQINSVGVPDRFKANNDGQSTSGARLLFFFNSVT